MDREIDLTSTTVLYTMNAVILSLCLSSAVALVPTRRPLLLARTMVLAEKAPAAAAAAAVDPAEPAPEEGAEVIEEAPPPPLWEVEEKALPFMPVPDNILNYEVAGNYGFDPLGFTDWVKVDWLREAEIKHGRICMLALVGFGATDCGLRLPGDIHQVSSIAAHDVALGYGAMQQLFLWISMFEIISSVAVNQMVNEGSGRLPGDFGLDPMGYCANEEATKKYKLNEIVHCRLAMFAFSGMVTQAVLTQGPYPYFS